MAKLHTQGTTIFVVTENSFEYVDIPSVSADKSHLTLHLVFDEQANVGVANWNFSGYEKWPFDYMSSFYKERDFQMHSKQQLQWDCETCEIENLEWGNQDGELTAHGQMSFPTKKIRNIGKKSYQSTDFIPIPKVLNSIKEEDAILWNALTIEVKVEFQSIEKKSPIIPDNQFSDGFWSIEYFQQNDAPSLIAKIKLDDIVRAQVNFKDELARFESALRTSICYEE